MKAFSELELVLDAIKDATGGIVPRVEIPCCTHCAQLDWSLNIEHDLQPLFDGASAMPIGMRDTGWTMVTIRCNACGFTTSAKRKLRDERVT